jgi:hypothetical protein
LLNLYGPTEIADGDFRSFKKKKIADGDRAEELLKKMG